MSLSDLQEGQLFDLDLVQTLLLVSSLQQHVPVPQLLVLNDGKGGERRGRGRGRDRTYQG